MKGKLKITAIILISIICAAALVVAGRIIIKTPVTYCGEGEKDGPWKNCNPRRYNVDGPAERLLNKGVSKIIMVDMTVGGPRFYKSFNTLQMSKRAIAAWTKRQKDSRTPVKSDPKKFGVLLAVHGGFNRYSAQNLWDSVIQIFSHDRNNFPSRFIIWNSWMWPIILNSGESTKYLRSYRFQYERIGGKDPFHTITKNQLMKMKNELTRLAKKTGIKFEVERVGWISGDDPSHYPYPRFMLKPDYDTNRVKTAIPIVWVNDITNLMERSYPDEPKNWTRTSGIPKKDRKVPLKGSPNPITTDPELARLHVDAITAGMSEAVSPSETGVILLNHALRDNGEFFDPKIDDTVALNKLIKTGLLKKYPRLKPANIIGGFMGIKLKNPKNGKLEPTRKMRGENQGWAWLYESNKKMPGKEWGYRYWDALDYLMKKGVKHIVIGFPQIVSDSVLNLVEVHNMFSKEIGYKTWLYHNKPDYKHYPGIGHPFADYWGIWVSSDCGKVKCCLKMGGCGKDRPYPPKRQAKESSKMSATDPSLGFDNSAFGNLGYNPKLGPPDENKPVQKQYGGTWALYRPPNDNPRLSKMMAKHVFRTAINMIKK
ncbi:hypothetical protein ACFL20_02940 [Spirochaetota bacterium]